MLALRRMNATAPRRIDRSVKSMLLFGIAAFVGCAGNPEPGAPLQPVEPGFVVENDASIEQACAALPRAGGVIRYPVYSHGPLLGYLMGFITLIAFSSLVAIEVVAARQYAAAWFPALTQAGSSNPTALGWLVQQTAEIQQVGRLLQP